MSSVFTPARVSLANILVATDFSDRSHLAVQFAAMLARSYRAGALCVVHVVPIAPLNPLLSGYGSSQSAPGCKDPNERVRESVSDIDFRGVRLSFEVRAGELSSALEDITVEEGTDVIVIASSGREGLGKLFRGSVAELVMRRSLCPVLVVGPRRVRGRPAPRMAGAPDRPRPRRHDARDRDRGSRRGARRVTSRGGVARTGARRARLDVHRAAPRCA